mgnify:CR=1 FL=1
MAWRAPPRSSTVELSRLFDTRVVPYINHEGPVITFSRSRRSTSHVLSAAQTPERRTGRRLQGAIGSKQGARLGPAHPCHTGRRPFMHSAGLYGPAGLLSPWTVRPLDVRNTLGAALSSARTALTRMFFDAGTSHQVRCARPEARRSLPRPPSSASAPVRGHGGIELFGTLLYNHS